MNYFVEGLQGSGKSTLVGRLSEKYADYKVYREGDYNPTELAWCSYVSKEKYDEILEKYSGIKSMIQEKSFEENGKMVICYTQILTDVPGFHKDLEQYEIYNNRRTKEEFRRIILDRYGRWAASDADDSIFECSLFQNIIEDMTLFQVASDDEILSFYEEIRKSLERTSQSESGDASKDFKIMYLMSEDIKSNIDIIRKERSDDQGNEMWFPLMLGYFNDSPYAKKYGVSGEEEMLKHFAHRQELEMRICREIFPGKYEILKSKKYDEI